MRRCSAGSGQSAPGARIGLEGSAGYGAAAARSLLEAGETVCEVPPQLSHRERLRTRRAGKSDPGDALAIARVTLASPTCRRSGPPTDARDPAPRRGARGSRHRGDPGPQPAPRRPRRAPARLPGERREPRRPPESAIGRRAAAAAPGDPGRARPRSARPTRTADGRGEGARDAASTNSSGTIRSGRCPASGSSRPPSSSARPATSAVSARPMRSRCSPVSPRSRRARGRPSGCGSTGAATASSIEPSM